MITLIGIFSIIRGKRGLSLSKVVGYDRLNQQHHALLRKYGVVQIVQFPEKTDHAKVSV